MRPTTSVTSLDAWINPAFNASAPGGLPVVGGVYSTILAYNNYVSPSSNEDYAWVMLSNDAVNTTSNPTASNYAQIGIIHSNPPTSVFQVEIEYTIGGVQQTAIPVNYTITPGNTYTFTVLYNPSTTNFTFYVNGTQQLQKGGFGWTPYQAEIAGEVHNNADQMFGAIPSEETFTGDSIYYSGWNNFNANGSAVPFNEGSASGYPPFTANTQFGEYIASSSSFTTSDNACPNTVSTGDEVAVNQVFDASGTSTDENIVSSSGSYYASITTSGQFYAGEIDPQCSCAKVLWYQPTYDAQDYLYMEANDNLALIDSWGNSVLWQTSTAGDGYSSPYLLSQNDGNLVLYGAAGVPLWSAGTNWASNVGSTGDPAGLVYGDTLNNGATLYSTNGAYHLTMQSDGNLVLYDASGALWQSGTSGDGAGVHLYLNPNGYMQLWNGSTYIKSLNASAGGSQNHLIVNNNGTFGWYTATNGTTWTS